jgi:hypothetical protein
MKTISKMNHEQVGTSISTGSLLYLTNIVTSKLLFDYACGKSTEWATRVIYQKIL